MSELALAARRLKSRPVFAIVAILTIALGVGGTTAIFSLFYQLLLRPLPYGEPDRLFFVWNSYPRMGLPKASVSIPDYLDRIEQAPSVVAATLMTERSINLGSVGTPEQLRALAVTPSFFETLGRSPELGRAFLESDAQPGADHSVILTNALWRARFGGNAALLGQDVRLGGEPYRVIGILPADFEMPAQNISMLVPFAFTPEQRSDQERGHEFSRMIARLAPGASRAALESEMATIVSRNLERLPDRRSFAERTGFRGYAVPIRDELVGDVRTPLYLLQAGVLLVLVIACVNVANLLLMRASERQRELAVRTALGAGRRHLVKELLTEALTLSVLGATLGGLLGVGLLSTLLVLIGDQLPAPVAANVHLPVLLAGVTLAVGIGVFVGLVPAVAILRSDVIGTLNDETGRTAGSRRSARAQNILVVAETALALSLLIGAGLLVKSFAELRAVSPGFSTTGVVTATLSLPEARYPSPTDRTRFWTQLVDNTRTIPGVSSVGLVSSVPLSGNVSSGSYSIVGYTPGAGEPAPHGRQDLAGADYFKTLQIPLIEGRFFDERDGADAPRSVIVDQYLVRRYFNGQSPLGRQIRRGGPTSPALTIVGVVGTVNAIDLALPVDKERLYYPVTQQPAPMLSLVLKSDLASSAVVEPLRRVVQKIDPEQPIANVRTMEEWVERSMVTRRAPMMLFTIFGGVALLLAALGTYGVLAFGVLQRTRELGLRQALGADSRAIVRLILWQGLRRAAFGVALGLVAALLLSRLLGSQLYGVAPSDPTVTVGSTLALLAVVIAACSLPAWRAAQLAPAEALRQN